MIFYLIRVCEFFRFFSLIFVIRGRSICLLFVFVLVVVVALRTQTVTTEGQRPVHWLKRRKRMRGTECKPEVQ